MGRGPSRAMKEAERYFAKHPGMKARDLADKFGIDTSTVYTSAWWKAAQQKAREAQPQGEPQ